jgi:AcrR family transcriptional regulator
MPPRPRTDPSAQTRKRILDTAERLFGERGVAAVSLRDINRAAGISQGVLHYHFGGRDALVEAILERALPAINAERRRMYEALVAAGKPPAARDVMEILCLPLARLAIGRQPAGRRFLRCLGRLHQEHNPVRTRVSDKYLADIPILDMLQALAPAAPRTRIEWYLGMVMNVIHATLGDVGRPAQPWQRAIDAEPMNPEGQVQALVDFICEGVGALA